MLPKQESALDLVSCSFLIFSNASTAPAAAAAAAEAAKSATAAVAAESAAVAVAAAAASAAAGFVGGFHAAPTGRQTVGAKFRHAVLLTHPIKLCLRMVKGLKSVNPYA